MEAEGPIRVLRLTVLLQAGTRFAPGATAPTALLLHPRPQGQPLRQPSLYVLQHGHEEGLHRVEQVNHMLRACCASAAACEGRAAGSRWAEREALPSAALNDGNRDQSSLQKHRMLPACQRSPCNYTLAKLTRSTACTAALLSSIRTCAPAASSRRKVLWLQPEPQRLWTAAGHELEGAVWQVVRPHRAADLVIKAIQVGVCMRAGGQRGMDGGGNGR